MAFSTAVVGPIKSNIPIPTTHQSSTGITSNLRTMKVGECFDITNGSSSTANVAHVTAKRMGIKILTRTVENSTVRIWRTE